MDGGEANDERGQRAGDGKRIRRQWTKEDKRRIMREAGRTGAVKQQIAEQNGVHVSLLNRWRREVGLGARRTRAKKAVRSARLLPVQVSRSSPPSRAASRPLPATMPSMAGDLIEVAFPAGQRVTVRGVVNGELLRAVLQELSRC
jgi:transposase-like protein